MIFLSLLLIIPLTTFAQTPEQLSELNAFPDEIIAKLQEEEKTIIPPSEKQILIHIGKIESMLNRSDNPNLYDFTVSYDDGRILMVTQDNSLGLKPNDVVKTTLKDGLTTILEKIY